jgi:uncharacterized protein (DUF427 family)
VRRVAPGLGQESVWDYPRPPRLEACAKLIVVEFAGERVAESHRAYRVLETSHPPTYYIHPDDVRRDLLVPSNLSTFCEFKGLAAYCSLVVAGRRSDNAAWYYPEPSAAFGAIRDHLAFYPSRVDACYVDGEPVQAQRGDFYGGWITGDIVGPFKGGPGSAGW